MPLGSARLYEALDARVLVEERVAFAQAECGVVEAQRGLLSRATHALSREPPRENPWKLVQRGATAQELLAQGYTFFELEASGATLVQLLKHLKASDLVRLGATYETLLRSGVREALDQDQITLADCLKIGGSKASLMTLLRDRVITSVSALSTLRPSADELRKMGANFELLLQHDLDVNSMREFDFTFAQWQQLGLEPRHLTPKARLRFDVDRDCARLGWQPAAVQNFLTQR